MVGNTTCSYIVVITWLVKYTPYDFPLPKRFLKKHGKAAGWRDRSLFRKNYGMPLSPPQDGEPASLPLPPSLHRHKHGRVSSFPFPRTHTLIPPLSPAPKCGKASHSPAAAAAAAHRTKPPPPSPPPPSESSVSALSVPYSLFPSCIPQSVSSTVGAKSQCKSERQSKNTRHIRSE